MSTGIVIIVILLTIFVTYQILLHFGVFEVSTQQKKVVSEIEDTRKLNKKRQRVLAFLKLCSGLTQVFRGILLTADSYEKHKYYIERLDIRSDILNRQLTPEELRGKHALPLFISLFFIPASIFVPFCIFVPAVFFVYFLGYQTVYKLRIQDEDEIIDNYFIDLYLLLYSKLRQGSRARLQGTVEQYIDTLEGQSDTDVKEVMLKFAKYMLNLLSLYEDHVAIPMLRDIYHSATIINFCNVASQALQGIDNFDNLLTFKMQLVERKTNLMRKRQQEILRSGERSIYAIWIILFIFIAVGWYSKLPTGMF